MWKEFAVQPECLVQSWDGFRVLFHQFGVTHGRWLVKYPAKDWLRLVYEALNASPLSEIAKQRIVESLAQGRDRMVKAGRPYDPALPWLPNAESQQATAKPFSGIIALENPRARADVMIADTIADTTPGFEPVADTHVGRNAKDMAQCIRGLLEQSREVILIDPYFGGLEARFYSVLLEIVAHLPTNTTRCEYHLAQRSLVLDREEFVRRLTRYLSSRLPRGLKIDFFIWEQRPGGEILHDRFVVTEIGGANFSVGLDEGAPGETTRVSRLSRVTHQKLLRDYSCNTAAFDLRHRCSVVGAG